MSEKHAACPICHASECKILGISDYNERFHYACSVCGRFSISDSAMEDHFRGANSHRTSKLVRSALSHRIRTAQDADRHPYISTHWFADFKKSAALPPANIQAANLIRVIGEHLGKIGTPYPVAPSTTAIGGCIDHDATKRLLSQLVKNGILIELKNQKDESETGIILIRDAFDLSLEGWEKFQEEKSGKIAGRYGFLALKFGDPQLEQLVQKHIKPYLKNEIGYELIDMRDAAQAGVIDNIMRAQIRDSAFVVCDLTHDNSGAYWEAGYAEGLGKPVIYICEHAKFESAKTHFDTNHCTTVQWSNSEPPERFLKELVATLRRSLNLFPSR